LHHFISVDYDMTKTDLRDPDMTQMSRINTLLFQIS
jgi:hypothetical protein